MIAGLLVLLTVQIPVIGLNRNMQALVFDQFDGELLTYVLRAGNPFADTIPELFNGTTVASMTPPAILFVLLYMVTSPAIAFFLQYLIVTLVAYFGMFACVHSMTKCDWIAAVTGVLFSLLPFYPVYGLSSMGQPLIFWCFYKLWEQSGDPSKRLRGKQLVSFFCIIVFFALSSSLVLAGFADVIILVGFSVYGLIRKRKMTFFISGTVLLGLVYLVSNWNLMEGVFGGSGSFVTHKSAYVVSASAESFFDSMKGLLVEGHYHAPSIHKWIIPVACIALVSGAAFRNCLSDLGKKNLRRVAGFSLAVLLISGFYAFWHAAPIADLRNRLGGVFIEFQVDRFYWLFPCLWYVLLASSVMVLMDLLRSQKYLRILAVAAVFLINGAFILNDSNVKVNAKKWLKGADTPNYVSVPVFFQEELFDRIDKVIEQPKDEYRVISVGLYPSIALYNKFYCLDGYSNNYDLQYKEAFRSVISGELEKSSELKWYFDAWGNRCYAFAGEIPFEYYVNKTDERSIQNLDYRFDRLKEMGCQYIFSALPIADYPEKLRLIDTFETPDSEYRVLLYKLV